MKRMLLGMITLALALTFVAPLTATAAPSATDMLKEQVASQQMIRALTGNLGSHNQYVDWIWFGAHHASSTKAVIPVYVGIHSGPTVTGTLVMKKSGGYWYFYSITRGTHEGGISTIAIPAGLTTSAIGTSISEQRAHQWMVTGIVNGGYKKLTVLSRSGNFGTRTATIKLSRGTRHAVYGRIIAYRKTATNGNKYWFLSAIK